MVRSGGFPTRVSVRDLAESSVRVGDLRGWDFSAVRAWRPPAPWSYRDVVASHVTEPGRTLDVGTGGGEVLNTMVSTLGQVIALDHQHRMAHTARELLGDAVSVAVADGESLPFEDEAFDTVLNRHARVFLDEFARVLSPGGFLITQQVGGRNMQSIFDSFGWGSNAEMWGTTEYQTARGLADEATALGLEVLRAEEYEIPYVLEDLDSLVFTLKAVPFPETFDPETHVDAVNRLLVDATTSRGVATTEHRELLVVQKS